MIIGNIVGKTSTNSFKFLVKGEAKKFQYIQIPYKENYMLSQIYELERTTEGTIAHCNILGYRENKILKQPLIPLEPGIEVLDASDDFIKQTLNLEQKENTLFVGKLNGKDINIYLDINKLLTKHIAILAKSGSGKSYSLAVLLEELLDKKIPILIIDPHGEYSSLKEPNPKDQEKLTMFGIKSQGYSNQIQEFSPDTSVNPQAKPLKLNSENLDTQELIHILPARLSNAQIGCLYSTLRNLDRKIDFNSLIMALEAEDNNAKWTLINIIEYLQKLDLFSEFPTNPNELIQPGKASIINLKGSSPEVQEVIVYKLVKELFEERKKGNIPPFFLVVEEAHNYVPERGYGETKSSAILRQVFAEGRKFGLGACLISQRPSRVEKNALSQVTTQIILKVTNPNDLRAISNSVEGLTSETEKEIINLPIGTALISGIIDLPLFVDIRPRKTKHGGESIKIIDESQREKIDVVDEIQKTKELIPVIQQKISKRDLQLMNEDKQVNTILVPCLFLTCSQDNERFNLLINLNNKELITNIEEATGKKLELPDLNLSPQQQKIFNLALKLREFKAAELFSQSGLQFSELYDIIKILTSKELLNKEGDIYKIKNSTNIFSSLKDFSCYEKPEFFDQTYDKKLEKQIEVNEILSFIKPFITIENSKECYLVTFSIG